jgi:hypothetical protein
MGHLRKDAEHRCEVKRTYSSPQSRWAVLDLDMDTGRLAKDLIWLPILVPSSALFHFMMDLT